MSVSHYQNNIARLTREIATLEKQLGDEMQRASRLQHEIQTIQRGITRSTSTSTHSMKIQRIATKQNEIGRATKRIADFRAKIASKSNDLHRNQQSLQRVQKRELKRSDAQEQQRRRQQARHMKQVTRELEQQKRATQFTTYTSFTSVDEYALPIGFGASGLADTNNTNQLPRVHNSITKRKRRRGGPIPTPKADKQAIIEGWLAVEGRVSQEQYCRNKGIVASTLRRWMKQAEEQE